VAASYLMAECCGHVHNGNGAGVGSMNEVTSVPQPLSLSSGPAKPVTQSSAHSAPSSSSSSSSSSASSLATLEQKATALTSEGPGAYVGDILEHPDLIWTGTIYEYMR
jgi:hypothetical protein